MSPRAARELGLPGPSNFLLRKEPGRQKSPLVLVPPGGPRSRSGGSRRGSELRSLCDHEGASAAATPAEQGQAEEPQVCWRVLWAALGSGWRLLGSR